MKRLLTLFTALVFAAALFASPLQAAVGEFIGGTTSGVDANGTSYLNGWVTGGDFTSLSDTYTAGDVWYESYAVDSQSWYAWYEITAFVNPLIFTTGDNYSTYTNLSDGAGGTAMSSIVNVDDISITTMQMANSGTGFLDYYYEYDDQSGTVGAYYEEIINYMDPSGSYNYEYDKRVDIDDGNYNDDWRYESDNWFEAGTGEGEVYEYFTNYVEGIRYENDYDFNSQTGYFDIDNNYYLDTDGDLSWTDNYYTYYDNWFDAYDGQYEEQTRMYDLVGLTTGGNAAYTNEYEFKNLYTGEFENSMDQRMDTDGDGSYNDYSSFGDFGAYRTYTTNEFYLDSDYPETYTETSLYDSINRQMSYSYSEAYTNGTYSADYIRFRWDADGDGQYTDDYYYTVDNYTEYGEIYQNTNLYDYVSTYSNRYYYDSWQDLDGSFEITERQWIDNDGDDDFNDYQNKGAYYSDTYSEFDSYEGYSYADATIWDPAGDYDPLANVFGTRTYTETESWIGGDNYSESSYAKDTDKDGTIETGGANDLWQYAEQDYDAYDDYTYSYSEVEEDTNNARGAYSRLWTESHIWAPSGDYENTAHVENLAGLFETSEGYDVDDNGYRWSTTDSRTWGVSKTFVENWSYDSGDFGVYSRIDLDDDNNTAYNNQNDWESYAQSWDEMVSWADEDGQAGGQYVGSYTYDWNNNNEFFQEFGYTSSGDTWEYSNYDGSTGNYIDQMLYYASGDLAGGAAPAFGTAYYDGPWAAPYGWVEYLFVGSANAWYLVDYNLL